MSRYLIHDLQSSITLSLLMRVFACFLYFSSLKKNEITQVCVRLFYSLHIQQWMRNHWKGQRTVAVIPFSDVGILNPKISCALLSHHLVNSCRLAHNFPAAWSMGSKENGLIQVLLYHVPGTTDQENTTLHIPCRFQRYFQLPYNSLQRDSNLSIKATQW